jgi:aerobic-type carbon monoxide dehydrogenase small subunit (CoxS/CutS family)
MLLHRLLDQLTHAGVKTILKRRRCAARLICFDLSSFTAMIYSSALGQGTARQIATVDPADMRGLVTT